MFLPVALVSLVFTGLLYFKGSPWLFPSILSYVLMGGLMYRWNREVKWIAAD